jgi:hypothetical protein
MNYIPGYIIYPNIREVVTDLDQTIALNKWRIFTGLRCTGKTRLLEEFVKREKLNARPHEIIHVSIDEPQSNSARGRRYSTPAAFLTFWEIDQALRALDLRSLRKYQRVPPPENTSVYDNMFPLIYQNVRTKARERKIRLFIIDNAQYADARTLKRLMALYQHLHRECAIILCAQRAPDEPAHKVLAQELRGKEMGVVRDTLLRPCELKRISRKLFEEEVMLQLLKPKNLGADFDNATAVKAEGIYDDLWKQVRSNWARIDYMAQLLALGVRQFSKQDERGVWMMTEEVVDWVLRMLGGDVSAAQGDEKDDDDEVDEAVAEAA